MEKWSILSHLGLDLIGLFFKHVTSFAGVLFFLVLLIFLVIILSSLVEDVRVKPQNRISDTLAAIRLQNVFHAGCGAGELVISVDPLVGHCAVAGWSLAPLSK